jgi:hypothetical protein
MPTQDPTDVELTWAPQARPSATQDPLDVVLSWQTSTASQVVGPGLNAFRSGWHAFAPAHNNAPIARQVGLKAFFSSAHAFVPVGAEPRSTHRQHPTLPLLRAGRPSLSGGATQHRAAGAKLFASGEHAASRQAWGAGGYIFRAGGHTTSAAHTAPTAGLRTAVGQHAGTTLAWAWTAGPVTRFGRPAVQRSAP